MISSEERLKAFQSENHITTKGPLSLVVQFTRMVRDKDFPLNPDDFKTSSKGQVAAWRSQSEKDTERTRHYPAVVLRRRQNQPGQYGLDD